MSHRCETQQLLYTYSIILVFEQRWARREFPEAEQNISRSEAGIRKPWWIYFFSNAHRFFKTISGWQQHISLMVRWQWGWIPREKLSRLFSSRPAQFFWCSVIISFFLFFQPQSGLAIGCRRRHFLKFFSHSRGRLGPPSEKTKLKMSQNIPGA